MKFKGWMYIPTFLIFCYISGCISQICQDRNSTKLWECCKNHEEINGNCVECRIGYVSDMGEHCHKCPNGTYGHKCLDICKCKAERCHHIKGCFREAETTMIFENESTTALSNSHHVTYGTSLSLAAVTNGGRFSEKKNENNDLSQVTRATEKRFVEGHLKTDIGGILTYSICTAGLTFIVLVLLYIYRYRYTLCKSNRKRRVELESNIVKSNVIVPEPNGDFEDVYEMIDESKMINYPFEMTGINIVDTANNANKNQDNYMYE